jgi:hypothetical protein
LSSQAAQFANMLFREMAYCSLSHCLAPKARTFGAKESDKLKFPFSPRKAKILAQFQK